VGDEKPPEPAQETKSEEKPAAEGVGEAGDISVGSVAQEITDAVRDPAAEPEHDFIDDA
jgi:hypothetical protein